MLRCLLALLCGFLSVLITTEPSLPLGEQLTLAVITDAPKEPVYETMLLKIVIFGNPTAFPQRVQGRSWGKMTNLKVVGFRMIDKVFVCFNLKFQFNFFTSLGRSFPCINRFHLKDVTELFKLYQEL